jgi:hypothetical protein
MLIQPGIPVEKLICCAIEGWSIKEAFQVINVHYFSYSAIFHTSKVLANIPSFLLISKASVFVPLLQLTNDYKLVYNITQDISTSY